MTAEISVFLIHHQGFHNLSCFAFRCFLISLRIFSISYCGVCATLLHWTALLSLDVVLVGLGVENPCVNLTALFLWMQGCCLHWSFGWVQPGIWQTCWWKRHSHAHLRETNAQTVEYYTWHKDCILKYKWIFILQQAISWYWSNCLLKHLPWHGFSCHIVINSCRYSSMTKLESHVSLECLAISIRAWRSSFVVRLPPFKAKRPIQNCICFTSLVMWKAEWHGAFEQWAKLIRKTMLNVDV